MKTDPVITVDSTEVVWIKIPPPKPAPEGYEYVMLGPFPGHPFAHPTLMKKREDSTNRS